MKTLTNVNRFGVSELREEDLMMVDGGGFWDKVCEVACEVTGAVAGGVAGFASGNIPGLITGGMAGYAAGDKFYDAIAD